MSVSVIDNQNANNLINGMSTDLPMKSYVAFYNEFAAALEIKTIKRFPTKAKAVERVLEAAKEIKEIYAVEIARINARVLEAKVATAGSKKAATCNLVKIGDKVHKLQHTLSTKLFKGFNDVTVRELPTKGYFNEAWFAKKNIDLSIDSSLELV